MEKKKLLKIVGTFMIATLLLSASTERFVASDPFIGELIEALKKYSTHQSTEKVYLQLDRNFYQPNDFIWYSAWIRDANTLRADNVSEKLYVELLDPNGTVMEKQRINALDGIGKGRIQLKTSKGGLYKIKAYTKWQENTKTYLEREIQVQSVVLPNLKMKLDFERKAYGPGDEVVANLVAKDLEDQELRLREFSYLISIDGQPITEEKMTMDFDGKAAIKFDLPEELKTRDGLLQVLIPHNGQSESIARAVPISLKDIDLQFFPEGGDMIAGLPSKVAFKALNEFGKPADVEGIILNKVGETVDTFRSYHNGMGATNLWPERGGIYTAKIIKPEGIDKVYSLPKVTSRGLQMGLTKQQEEGLEVAIHATRPQAFHLIAQSNEKVLFSKSSVVDKRETIQFSTKDFPMGITRLSLFNERGEVASERLVFINPHKRLNIDIKTDKKQYQPREEVKMSISVKDYEGNPVVGNFALAVADDKLLTFADDKQGHILSKLFLESELKGRIEEPDFYFDEKEEKALLALDYLMMTQGWRRYDWKEVRSDKRMALRHQKERSWISGRVVDGKNKGIADAEVKIVARNKKTETDKYGYFIFKNVEIGKIAPVLEVNYEGSPTVRKSIVDYKQDYHIVLSEKRGSISGLLLLPSNIQARRAEVQLYSDNGSIWSTYTDNNGEYAFHHLKPGSYSVVFRYRNMTSYQVEKVMIWPSENLVLSRQFYPLNASTGNIVEEMAATDQEVKINTFLRQKIGTERNEEQAVVQAAYQQKVSRGGSANLDEIVVVQYCVPMVEQDNTTQGAIRTDNSIRKFTSKSITTVAASTAGLSQLDEGDGITVRGSRSNATAVYIDGIRVSASSVQEADVEQLQIITGGIPAYYGSGVTRLPERKTVGTFKNKKEQAVYHHRETGTESEPIGEFISSSGGGGGGSYGGYSYRGRRLRTPFKLYTIVDKPAQLITKKCKNKATESDCYNCANEVLLQKFMAKIGNYRIQSRQGADMTIEFFVNKKGKAGGVQVRGSNYNYFFNRELQKILDKLDDWKPAEIDNKKVASKITIPISIGDKVAKRNSNCIQVPEFYAPKYIVKKPIEKRTDFRSTIFWKPDVETDENGEARITFWNSDNITSFEVRLEGLSNNGFAGERVMNYSVQMPFSMSAKMPVVLLEGDEVKVPITLGNNTAETISGELDMTIPDCLILQSPEKEQYLLKAGEHKTIYPIFKVKNNTKSKQMNQAEISFGFTSGDFQDHFSQKVRFQSDGFPISKLYTGTELNNEFTIDIQKPREGTIKAKLMAHANVTSEVMASCERMLKQPHGCFEQTSSYNYPNVLVMQYLNEHRDEFDAALYNKAKGILDFGYKRLMGFEVKTGGFEWHGNPPAHDALTAYGILEFVDMKEVYPVEQAMIDRTVAWMLKRKDGKGGWIPNKARIYRWGPSPEVRNAYINWALSAAGFGNKIKEEIEQSYKTAISSDDPYILALVANTLLNIRDKRSKKLIEKLMPLQQDDGLFVGAKHSITNSRGKNLDTESTALAALALTRYSKKKTVAIVKAIDAISKSKNAYGFGSTQATILSIKAILAYADMESKKGKEGMLALFVDEKLVEERPYSTKLTKAISFNDFGNYLKEGSQKIEVRFDGSTEPIPFEVAIDYSSAIAEDNGSNCKISLDTKLANSIVKQGQSTRLSTTMKNETEEIVTSPIAIIGIPAGLSPQPWQLKKLQEEKQFAFYEVLDNKVVFYFYQLAANEEKKIQLDLKADIPGRYLGPASNAYLYYENDAMAWKKPQEVTVLAY